MAAVTTREYHEAQTARPNPTPLELLESAMTGCDDSVPRDLIGVFSLLPHQTAWRVERGGYAVASLIASSPAGPVTIKAERRHERLEWRVYDGLSAAQAIGWLAALPPSRKAPREA